MDNLLVDLMSTNTPDAAKAAERVIATKTDAVARLHTSTVTPCNLFIATSLQLVTV